MFKVVKPLLQAQGTDLQYMVAVKNSAFYPT